MPESKGFRIENPAVRRMRPTAKLVYATIRDAERPLAQHEVADRTNLAARGVRDVLEDLEDEGLVHVALNLEDMREKQYSLPENSG